MCFSCYNRKKSPRLLQRLLYFNSNTFLFFLYDEDWTPLTTTITMTTTTREKTSKSQPQFSLSLTFFLAGFIFPLFFIHQANVKYSLIISMNNICRDFVSKKKEKKIRLFWKRRTRFDVLEMMMMMMTMVVCVFESVWSWVIYLFVVEV